VVRRAVAGWVVIAIASCGGRGAPVTPPGAEPAAAGDGSAAGSAAGAPRFDPLSEASLRADIAWLTADDRHGRGEADAPVVVKWLVDQLSREGYEPVLQPIARAPNQHNVIAVWKPGGAPDAPTTILSAHYDHLGIDGGVIYPGADDNASGVAAALAVARDIARRGDVTGRVVFLFTGGEEIGLLGAKAYVAAPTYPLASTRVINLDMVGRRLFESAGDIDAALGAIGPFGDASDAVHAAAERAELQVVAVRPGMVSLIGQDWRTDDWVFRDAGVPAIHFSTGLHDDYHQSTDTVDRISWPQMVRVATFLRHLIAGVAR
jgi:Zn-dependent M28 family amino/carboxypeptidase